MVTAAPHLRRCPALLGVTTTKRAPLLPAYRALVGSYTNRSKKVPRGAENAVLQPADTGRVARAFRAARDRQAVPQGLHRRLRESRRHQVRIGLFAGGRWTRTIGTASESCLGVRAVR